MEDIVFAPCSKCGSVDYDKASYTYVVLDEVTGMYILEPDECDKCTQSCAQQLPH